MDSTGEIIYAHEFLNANGLTVPYMKTANLPIRWEIAGSAVGSMLATCGSVISEGGTEFDRGFTFSHASATITAGNGTRTPIDCLRPAATFNSIVNRIQVSLEEFSGLVIGNNPVLWEIVYNPTITGGAWVNEGVNSSVAYNITAASMSGGEDTQSSFAPGTASTIAAVSSVISQNRLPLTLDPAGANPITIALCATGIGEPAMFVAP